MIFSVIFAVRALKVFRHCMFILQLVLTIFRPGSCAWWPASRWGWPDQSSQEPPCEQSAQTKINKNSDIYKERVYQIFICCFYFSYFVTQSYNSFIPEMVSPNRYLIFLFLKYIKCQISNERRPHQIDIWCIFLRLRVMALFLRKMFDKTVYLI